MVEHPDRQSQVNFLRDKIAKVEKVHAPRGAGVVSSGVKTLDDALPDRGVRRGALVEWLAAEQGGGTASLALRAAAEAAREGGAVVVFDRAKTFYPPAAVRLGIAEANLVVIQASSLADEAWALDQALRCPGVAAAVVWVEKLDAHSFRRLQLAAEEGQGLGLLIRPCGARTEPSWADVRLLVEPLPGGGCDGRRLRVTILRCRGGAEGRCVEIGIGDETHPLPLVAPMAYPAAAYRATGA